MSAVSPNDLWTGDYLLESGRLTPGQLAEAEHYAAAWGSTVPDALLARNWLDPQDYFRALARRFAVEYVDLVTEPLDPDLVERDKVDEYMRELTVPWRKIDGRLVVATARPGHETVLYVRRKWGSDTEIAVCTKFALRTAIQSLHSEEYSHEAVYDLAEQDPEMSARIVFTAHQLVFAWAALSLTAIGLYFNPVVTLIAINAFMSVFYLGNFVFKAIVVWAGGARLQNDAASIDSEAALLRDEDLPIYTVLVPMFREPDVLPILANALRKLDYPTAKLDIKIILEEGDAETIAAARALRLEQIFEIVIVPPSQPQTKPKACNYAFRFARGEYLVIYDAEDKPEPDQLKKVVAAFRRSPDNIGCVQCRLNYYNRDENWLTRMFTLDYSLWFDLMLPGLEKLGVPIPLGGTSNHFKMSVLQELRAWDPFNVTEDADLGIRMTQKGYGVRLVDSTTFEEANVSQGNWIRQRSRWIKGYMQTFLVHTRRPLHLARTVGPLGVLGFVFFIGGTMLSGLLNPLFWAIFLFWLVSGSAVFDSVFPPILLELSLFNLLAGNGLFIFLMMLAPYRRNWLNLVPFALTVFWYWVLMSIAAWKGAWQLVTKPFYWEKTNHGLSKHTANEVAAARAEVEAAV